MPALLLATPELSSLATERVERHEGERRKIGVYVYTVSVDNQNTHLVLVVDVGSCLQQSLNCLSMSLVGSCLQRNIAILMREKVTHHRQYQGNTTDTYIKEARSFTLREAGNLHYYNYLSATCM